MTTSTLAHPRIVSRDEWLAERKVMSLFCNMDRMVGGMFEEGLADLKTVAEK